MPVAGKVVFIVLDGVGVGELPDAAKYGDAGCNTLAHVAEAVGGLDLPNLQALGLGNIAFLRGVQEVSNPRAGFGKMAEASRGKDSTTGHWELAGLILREEFPLFHDGFPADLMESFLRTTGCKGYLGNRAASGTVIIQELGARHFATGYPIVYTSADSVFQIAAHERVIPLERLYEICRLTRQKVCTGSYAVGRVIARPFTGEEGRFIRTTDRKDFSLVPPGPTMLDVLWGAGVATTGIGKIDDLYAGRGLTRKIHTRSNQEGIACILSESRGNLKGFIMANLVDFDMLYGHRNDADGFARALSEFDRALPAIIETLGPDDLLLVTADHGNDPLAPGTDHTREYVPLLLLRRSMVQGEDLGVRSTFADAAKTVVEYFGVTNSLAGRTVLGRPG